MNWFLWVTELERLRTTVLKRQNQTLMNYFQSEVSLSCLILLPWTQGISWHQAQFRSWQLEYVEVSVTQSKAGAQAMAAMLLPGLLKKSAPLIRACLCTQGSAIVLCQALFTILKQGKSQAGCRKKGTKSFLASEHWEFRMWWGAEKLDIPWAFTLTAILMLPHKDRGLPYLTENMVSANKLTWSLTSGQEGKHAALYARVAPCACDQLNGTYSSRPPTHTQQRTALSGLRGRGCT